MRRADFSYPLPKELIAERPLPRRGASRLLALNGATGGIRDLAFEDFGGLLNAGDLVVLNDTRVLPARLQGRKASGGSCELLLERILDGRRILAQARASKGLKPGTRIDLPGGASAVAVARRGDLHELELDREALPYFEAHGSVPLPPYVAREAEPADRERYQTVYARCPVPSPRPPPACTSTARRSTALAASRHRRRTGDAARRRRHLHAHARRGRGGSPHARGARPRAGGDGRRHRGRARSRRPRRRGRHHGGAGARGRGRRGGRLAEFAGETDIFIRPGHRFRVVDALLTNFHLPESTLLVLVSAFAGRERVLAAYHHAIAGRYRFFSYGDAMFVTPDPAALAARGAAT